MAHPSTEAVLRFFGYSHLPAGRGKEVSTEFYELAYNMATYLPEDPETTVALRKLLEAKDAAVRAALVGDGLIS